MSRGGARPGAGRPAKAEKYGGHVAAAEDRIADRLPELIDNLFRLAAGVQVYRARKGKGPIAEGEDLAEADEAEFYLTPPDFRANEYLINRILGRPTERHEHTGADGGPIEFTDEARADAARELDQWRKQMSESLPPAPTPPAGPSSS